MDRLSWWNPFDWGTLMIEGAQNKLGEIFTEILKDFMVSSYWLCLIVGVIGLILYLCGLKKCKAVSTIATIIYVIIRIVGCAIIGA